MNDRDKAEKDLPKCMVGSPLDSIRNPSLLDMVFYVETEIDLTEEGQDGTSRRNLKPLRNWLKKFCPQSNRIRSEVA